MKNERIIAVVEKNRVNKKIRRIFIIKNRILKKNAEKKRVIIVKKERVNAEFLKFVFSIYFLFSFFFFNRVL